MNPFSSSVVDREQYRVIPRKSSVPSESGFRDSYQSLHLPPLISFVFEDHKFEVIAIGLVTQRCQIFMRTKKIQTMPLKFFSFLLAIIRENGFASVSHLHHDLEVPKSNACQIFR